MKMIFSLKRDRLLATACIFLMTATLVAGMAGCNGGGGYVPPPSKNLEIRTWYDLDEVRDNLAGNHTLMNDLNSTTAGYVELAGPTANGGKGWEPYVGFMGSFDGQGHEIRDLFINRPDEDDVGLFAGVELSGVIKNIGVVNASVTGCEYVGGMVAVNGGSVSNSYFTGALTGDRWVGGLVGWNEGTVSNSYSSGGVTGNRNVGGLVGNNDGNVSNSYSSGNVTGDTDLGGLVSTSDFGTVSNSYYNYDAALINGENIITMGALFEGDFDQWLANDKVLDVNERLSQEDGYYLINNVSDFKELLAFGQNGTLKFRLTGDLNLAAEPGLYIPYLAGEFDGNGHKISNLSFNFGFVSNVGLFGRLAPGGEVTQVGIENVNVTALQSVGGLVGASGGTVSHSYATGSVTGNGMDVGGLVGWNWEGTVSNSYATGDVTGIEYVGGLAGKNHGNVSDSYSSANVIGTVDGVGGLLGINGGTVADSYSIGSVTGDTDVGGLAGANLGGNVSNSYATGSVTGRENVGGLVGNEWGGALSNSYAAGSVIGHSNVGGLVGQSHYGTVSESYSIGSVSGVSRLGGLVGYTWYGTVSNSYSTGNVTGNYDVGGLLGLSDYGAVTNSFWDIQTSGQATSDGGTGKNTSEMQDILTFSGAGWNITAVALNETDPAYIWNIVTNVTYPFLSWQPV